MVVVVVVLMVVYVCARLGKPADPQCTGGCTEVTRVIYKRPIVALPCPFSMTHVPPGVCCVRVGPGRIQPVRDWGLRSMHVPTKDAFWVLHALASKLLAFSKAMDPAWK